MYSVSLLFINDVAVSSDLILLNNKLKLVLNKIRSVLIATSLINRSEKQEYNFLSEIIFLNKIPTIILSC